MHENDRVDEVGVPLWYRLAQALCPTSEAVLPETFQIQARHLVRRLAQRGIVLAIEPREDV